MPRNCSSDVQAVVEHIDEVLSTGTQEEKQSIKDLFGMGNVTHSDDVAGALRNNIWDWQGLRVSAFELPAQNPGPTCDVHSCSQTALWISTSFAMLWRWREVQVKSHPRMVLA
jgi:hypothetical protein